VSGRETKDNFAHLEEVGTTTQAEVMAYPPPEELRAQMKALGISDEALTPEVGSLADLANKVVFGDIWNRPGLSRRERRIVTLTALAMHGQMAAHGTLHVKAALDSGDLTAEELREIGVQMAPYAGWPLATGFSWVVDAEDAARHRTGSDTTQEDQP
jgi:alkylhydroperoxidase/carboxymuconolactone decarboxylase family protein YurZ